MSYEPAKSPTAAIDNASQPAPAPQGPSGQSPLSSRGPLCEQPGVAAANPTRCLRTPRQRDLDLITLTSHVTQAVGNWRDALQDTRIDIIARRPPNLWGAGAEFLFYSFSGLLVEKLVAGTVTGLALGARAAANVRSAIINGQRSLRKILQSAAEGHGPGVAGKARFLQLLRATIAPTADAIVTAWPADLFDDELAALIAYMDPAGNATVWGVDACRVRIENQLALYESEGLAMVGEVTQFRHGQPVWVTIAGIRRMVILHDYALDLQVVAYGTPASHDLVLRKHKDGSIRWVTPEATAYAEAIYQDKTGAPVPEVNMSGLMTIDPNAAGNEYVTAMMGG